MKTITIQPREMENKTLPYPYHIDKNGLVGRQDFWKGRPFKLIGFAKSNKINKINLIFEDWFKNPNKCIGMFAVLEYKKSYTNKNIIVDTDETDFATNTQAIESIKINQ